MEDQIKRPSLARLISGIADYDKESVLPNAVAWMRSIDFRSDPRKLTILPATQKESGSVYQGLPKWHTQRSTTTYIYDNAGNLYERSSAGSHSLIRSVASSHGNGLAYYGEDDFVYYTTDKAIGRYGQFSAGSPAFADDFLASEGGVPTNTKSMLLTAASSEYAAKADNAGLSITGDISMEIYFKPNTLPAIGDSMVLLSKWNENSDERSYKFDIYAISGYFEDGTDGAKTVSVDETDAPIDSSATGTLGSYSLTATNASFASGQVVLIIQMQGTGAGTWQRTKIVSYTAGTITLEDQLNFSYSSSSGKAQVIVMKRYADVTINSGKTWTAKAWDGSVGGILAFLANGTVTITGTISATGKGYRGGANGTTQATQGEGSTGVGTTSVSANGTGGGGGQGDSGNQSSGGGGGGHATSGTNGQDQANPNPGIGGGTGGTTDLTTMILGGGGGGGGRGAGVTGTAGSGGIGGGGIFISSAGLTITGSIVSNGNAGGNGSDEGAGGGGGAGGSILLKVQTATLGSILITATAGSGGTAGLAERYGGAGGLGRIHIDYYTSYTGTSTPTLTATQDNSLVTTTTYQLRLQISNDGTAIETYGKNANITEDEWNHVAVLWDASAHTAEFVLNGVSIGNSVGSFSAIYDSTASYAIGASYDSAGAAENFLDAYVDEPRLWNTLRTAAQIASNKDLELIGNDAGLVAYHTLDGSLSDLTANANNFTHSGSATYSSDVPFAAPTTRLDIDQEDASTGDTYALGTSIDEGASHRQTFVPEKDPQKSIAIYIGTKPTNATITLAVHDALNREVTSKTLANADIPTSGFVDFVFPSTWRPILGANYHFHVIASNTTGTPTIVAGTNNNLETGEFKSYYQFLVTDTEWHPLLHYGNILAIGNERYLAVWNASSYNPHRLKFPSGHRVRALGFWNGLIAIGCMLGATIGERDQGRIFFWDGYSDTYVDFIDVPEGAINAMLGSVGELHFIAGYQGDYLIYSGGRKAKKVKRIPKITKDKQIEIYPGAMAMWQSLMRIGVGSSDSSVVERGVYTRGSLNEFYPEAFSYDYPISSGSRLSTVTIGMVAAVGKKLLIGWQDGVAYGVDVVDPAGDPYTNARIEMLIDDQGGTWKEKILSKVRADVVAMETGESIAIQQKLDRGDWTDVDIQEDDDRAVVKADINAGRHREYQIAIDLNTTVSTAPSLLSLTPEENINPEEDVT